MPLNGSLKQSMNKTGSMARSMELRFALFFLLIFFALQYAYSASRGSTFEHLIIDMVTVRPSAAIISLISPAANAMASGHRITSPQGSLSILNGCEGTETVFLLLAAIIAFTAPWRHKLKGALIGTLLIYAINQGRIVALFFAAQQNRNWFDLLHGYVAPTLIIVLGCLFFLWWANAAHGNEHSSAA